MLPSGPQPAAELKSLAKADGIHERTLLRAKSRLGLVTRRKGIGAAGTWIWQWPEGRPMPPAAGATRRGEFHQCMTRGQVVGR